MPIPIPIPIANDPSDPVCVPFNWPDFWAGLLQLAIAAAVLASLLIFFLVTIDRLTERKR